jgi:hypothetical protein
MLAPLVLSVAAGCVGTSEPTSPCPAIDLGHAEPATFVTPSDAPVVAVSHGEDQSFVAHRVCEPDDGPCRIVRTPLEDLPPGSQVLLTASGKHIVGVAASFGQTLVLTWDVGPDGVTPGKSAWAEDATAAPAALVGSMRGLPGDTDWVIARTAPNADGTRKLLRYKPGQQGNPEYLATNVPELLVSAIGERFLVGRQVHNGGEETLHLVDVLDDFTRDEARPLLRGRTFSRVMLSPGDAMVIATSGEGEDAETFVFDTDDGTLLDRFSGAAVSGRARGEELPGMRAASSCGTRRRVPSSHRRAATPGAVTSRAASPSVRGVSPQRSVARTATGARIAGTAPSTGATTPNSTSPRSRSTTTRSTSPSA